MNTTHEPSTEHRNRSAEEGSAYILTLMILLVLTVVGLSLTLVTQTEVLVGDQERVIQRVFYAAEGGLNLGLSRTFDANYGPFEYETRSQFDVQGSSGMFNVADRVTVFGFVPVGEETCYACQENQGREEFKMFLFAATAQATRTIVDMAGNDDVPLARKSVTYTVQTFPMDAEHVMPALLPNPEVAGKIKL